MAKMLHAKTTDATAKNASVSDHVTKGLPDPIVNTLLSTFFFDLSRWAINPFCYLVLWSCMPKWQMLPLKRFDLFQTM